MSTPGGSTSDLPRVLGSRLDALVTDLRESLGDRLRSIVLFGGLAKGDEFAIRTSSAELLLLVRDGSVATLGLMLRPVRKAERDLQLTTLVLSEEDLRTSADVFPVRFLDMQRHHRVLYGEDALAGLSVARRHYRLRCEQEIKNLLLRLRAAFVRRSHRRRLLARTLADAGVRFVDCLASILILRTDAAPALRAEILEVADRELSLDIRPLQETLALARGKHRPPLPELRRLYGRFLDVVERAAELADRDVGESDDRAGD